MAPPTRPLAVVDIDGVVADVRHRLHHVARRPKDWDAFFAAAPDDAPHAEGLECVQALAREHDIVFLTGRPERCRADTVAWLDRHGLGGHDVIMRPERDRRPAAVVKLERLRHLARTRTVAAVVDDDPIVVDSIRQAGFPAFLADWERLAPERRTALLEAQEVEGRT
jgi:hypothetical protein